MVIARRAGARAGRLIVFEGIDGVGKTTLAAELKASLLRRRIPTASASFPGQDPGTLAAHVYSLYHSPERFGVKTISHEALQLLLTAAHIDVIRTSVAPALRRGEVVILDRFWWSTWVYGRAAAVAPGFIDQLLSLEMLAWMKIKPTQVFFVTRRHRDAESSEPDSALVKLYETVARRETHARRYPISCIANDGSIADALELIEIRLRGIGIDLGSQQSE